MSGGPRTGDLVRGPVRLAGMTAERLLPSLVRRTGVALAAVVLAGLVGAGVGVSPAAAAPEPAPLAVDETPSPIALADCPVPVPRGAGGRVQCGVLTVPETPGDSDPERTVELPYAVVSSASRSPEPDPVVIVVDTGTSVFDELAHILSDADWATDTRDVILLERRGGPYAAPALDCPQIDADRFIADGALLTGDRADAQRRRALNACQTTLAAQGVDLSAYSSRRAVSDLMALRAALGYEAWNLYGIGEGTRLAMTALRDEPDGLRAVILDSPRPPEVNVFEAQPAAFSAAIGHLLDVCAADLHCAERYPLLDLSLRSVLNRASVDPLEVTVAGPAGEPVIVVLDETALARGLSSALSSADGVRILPFVIDQLADGNADAATALAQRALDGVGDTAEGVTWSVTCAEEAPFNDPEAVAAAAEADAYAALVATTTVFDVCAVWEASAAGESATAAVTSGIPTLLMTGGFDPTASPAWAEAAAESLGSARVVHVPSMARGVVWETEVDGCPASIARAFLAQPDTGGSAACVERMERPAFLTTADIDPTPAMFTLSRDVIDSGDPLTTALPIGLGAALAAGLLYGLILTVKPSLRTSPDVPAGAPLALIASTAFLLAYAAALVIVLVAAEPLLLTLGLPASVWPILLLPWAGIAATALLVALMIVAWVKDDGELSHRIALSAFTLTALGAIAWLFAHGLLLL